MVIFFAKVSGSKWGKQFDRINIKIQKTISFDNQTEKKEKNYIETKVIPLRYFFVFLEK